MVEKGRRCESGQGGRCYNRQLVVGCALLPKKVTRYLTAKMMATAAMHNIQLVQIDYTRSLLNQGPFDVIVHKLRPSPAWEQFLYEYKAAHPEVCIIDRLDRIKALHNRATMLTPLKGQGISLAQPLAQQERQQQLPQLVRVQAPLQVEIGEGATEADAQAALAAAGLSPPLLCKPLWTDGREGSHGLAVLHDLEELGRLLRGGVSNEFKPPLVVQQFVEHGGVLFKVYVLGSQTVVTARPSLGEQALEAEQGVQQLPRISCVSVFGKQLQRQQQQQCVQDPCCQAQQPAAAEAAPGSPEGLAAAAAAWRPPATAACPPEWVTASLAATLRQELGMQLFNFDLIVPEQQEQQGDGDAPPLCYVVDINYFPGVDKISNFEQRFVALLREVAEEHEQRQQPKRQRQQQHERQELAAIATEGSKADLCAAGVTSPPSKESDSCRGATAAKQTVPAIQQQQQQQLVPVATAPPGATAVQLQQAAPSAHPPGLWRHSYSGSGSSGGGSSGGGSWSGNILVGCGTGGLADLHLGGSCSPSHRARQAHHRHPRRSHEGFGVDVSAGGCVGVMGSSPPLLEV